MKTQILLMVCLLFVACGNPQKKTGNSSHLQKEVIPNRYASGFKITTLPDGFLVEIGHPSDHSQPFQSFVLYKTKPIPVSESVDFQLKIPITKTAALAMNHIGFIDGIGKLQTVKGVTDPFRVYNPQIRQGVKDGRVLDLGTSMSPDKEKIITLRPDVVFMSGFPSAPGSQKLLSGADIPIVYTVAWTEKTPLARAEWIKIFGLMYDQKEKADSIFKYIDARYTALKDNVQKYQEKPSVFCGNSFKGVWYVPGGNSYVAHFIEDAGGDYIFSDDSSSGSLSVSFEVVYTKARDADYWLNVQEKSVQEMLIKDARYESFNPIIQRNVYNRLGRGFIDGGNDYFETGTWHPEIVLRDLIHILHRQQSDSALVFYKRLEE